ncbi:MAG: type 1 glutamine amidotransferase [Rickettsiales bacterium]
MKIHYFQHVDFEEPALINTWAEQQEHRLSYTKLYNGEQLPDISEYDALVIMGGSMSVHDEDKYKWLKPEKEHLKQAIKEKKHILGICLGAQLIAESLGAKIAKMSEKEIGWFPIAWQDAAMGNPLISGINLVMSVFHWHGEEFSIPDGAIHLASSKACANQAFLYNGNVLGLQFHLEMDENAIDRIIKNCGDELTETGGSIQQAEIIKQKSTNIASCERALFSILDKWIATKL